jgi:autotransporter-associated beta strand protein
LLYTGSGDDTDRLVRTNRDGTILNNGTGALNFTATGNFNLPVSQTIARGLTFGGTNGGTISGALQNNTNTAPALSVAKIGSGTWTLAGTNTYTGNTDVNAGTLRLQSGTTPITQTLGALRSRLADGTLISNKPGGGNLTTTFSSYSRSTGATGNIVSTGGTNGTDNSVNITGTAGFINAGLFFGGSDFAARDATNGYVRALNYATTGGDLDTVDGDTVTASKHVKLITTSYSDAGVALLSLNLAAGGIDWTNTSGTLTTPGILKSGGGSQGTISGGTLATASNAELIIRTDTANDSLLISSVVNSGSGALTKSGAGTLTLSETNTYTGQTHVNAGTLSIGANGNLGAETTGATLNLKGGTLQATGTFGLFNGTAGNKDRLVTLLDQSSIEVTGSDTLTIAGAISNHASAGFTTPGFNKTGTGTLLLSGANTYTGGTTINAGTLTITGTTQATNSISFSGGSLGLDTGVTVTAARAAVDLSNGTIEVTGSTGAASYTLLTAASITGSPVLAAPLSGYQLQVIDGAKDELLLVQSTTGSPYETWATGNEPFGGDANGDGISNGLAFLLGASGPNVNALAKLPTVTETASGLVLTFQMLDSASRGTASLNVEHSSDLGITDPWTTVAVPDTSDTVGDVVFSITGTGTLDVTATIPASKAAAGKLFGRLKGVTP